jgi:CRISPR type III-B/RAMP module RAMP protein Cmr1
MDENTNWFLIQEKVKEKNWLFTIRFTNSSYLRVGGYNARPYSIELNIYEKVRSSKIKGFLRWWTRVLTLGQNPSLTNYKDADEEISKYVGSEKKEFGQSKFFLDIKCEINKKAIEEFRNRISEIIDYITNKKKIGNEQLRELGDVARIKLISLERKEEKDKPEKYRKRLREELSLYPPYSITVTLSVYTYKSDKSDFTHILASGLINLLGSAILMLIFSGFSAFSKEIPEIKEVTNMESSLRARSREMPSLIQEIGLIGALSYCFSKGNEFYNGIMELIKGKGSKEQTEEYIKKIKDYAEKTDTGYSIYLYILLNAINYTGILNFDINKPYDAIKVYLMLIC